MSWTPHTLDQLGYLSRGRSRHRPRDAAHLYGGPYPFVQTGDIKHAGLYIREYQQTYSEAGLEQSRLWPVGTLCITIAANIADTAILAMDACFPDSVIGFIPNENQADARFVKYLFDATIQRRVRQFTQGSAQDNLSQEKLLSIEFSVPEVDSQKRIADMLSAYDDLIENNRRRIQLLEQAARLLYEEWFIRLRFPGHESTRITNGVPERWESSSLGKLVEIKKGKNITREMTEIGTVPVVAGGLEPAYFHSTANAKGPVVTISASGANAGYVNIYFQDVWASDCSFISAEWTNDVYYYFCLLKYRQQELFALHKGTAQPHIYPKDLQRLGTINPPARLLRHFVDTVGPSFALIVKLVAQNRQVRAARDLLLPRLMSGEIAV